MSITKKELFKLCDENNDAINELRLQSDSTDFVLATLIQQLKDGGIISELGAEPQPQLKQLDQSIFNGLDEKWRWYGVNSDGSTIRATDKPKINIGNNGFVLLIGDSAFSEDNYDTSNWQNSLIERDTATELTGSDLARAMLARGDKFILCGVSDSDDSDAANHEDDDFLAEAVTDFDDTDGLFGTTSMRWNHAVPINNQGEPLTAAEAGF